MTNIVLYFQVHQPFRLRNYTFFNIGQNHLYEGLTLNFEILNRIADRCYLPANDTLLRMIKHYGKDFRVAFSISGTALEQFEMYRPDVVESFKKLVGTGQVELLSETYFHSLAALYSPTEFERQVTKHKAKLKKLFDYEPTTFRNTELIYDNNIAVLIQQLGFKQTVAEGVDSLLNDRPVTHLYKSGGDAKLNLLLRHYTFSDDVAFRFTEPRWPGYPLDADKYAGWIAEQAKRENGESIGIFMDYETFGEHRPLNSGILDFLFHLPAAVSKHDGLGFATPDEVLGKAKPKVTYDVKGFTSSWADANRDISGWVDSHMQRDALKRAYALEQAVMDKGSEPLLHTWGKLLTSDHFYYMSTRYWADGIRQTFSPYKSPFDAYINYMNVLADFELTVK